MKRSVGPGLAVAVAASVVSAPSAANWLQWGAGPAHENSTAAAGQRPEYTLADVVYDALVPQQGATLFVHYQAPIVDGDDVFMTFKSGTYTDAAHWDTQTWNVERRHWTDGVLGETWSVASDWKPEPNALAGWEPVFHPALHGGVVYAPGASGSLLRRDRSDGHDLGRVSPFGTNAQIYVAGPLTVDGDGNVYYNAMQLDAVSPAGNDVLGAWLVRVTPAGVATTVDYGLLVPGAPAADAACEGQFANVDLPWPPAPDAVVPNAPLPCGSQRPGINVAPAVASDGTIYTISRAHRNDRYGYLVAVNPDLSPKWAASLRGRFADGCNVLIPPNGADGGCRTGATTGIDPATNQPGAGRVLDQASASPVVAPDGGILYGAYTRYNYSSGHLMKFAPNGDYVGSYPFGWDLTPSIWRHDGTYSVVLKENHYDTGSYCGSGALCGSPRMTITPDDPEQYFITQISAALAVEWKFKSTNTLSCERQPDGSLACADDHPQGFEWCINAPAIDANGVVFANSEDGSLYAIAQGGTQSGRQFLQLATGAAYTPLAIGDGGRVYTQNFGHLFVVGTPPDRIFAGGFD